MKFKIEEKEEYIVRNILPTDNFELDQINRGQKGNKEASRVL